MKTESELYQYFKTELITYLRDLEKERQNIVKKIFIWCGIIFVLFFAIIFILFASFPNIQIIFFIVVLCFIIIGFLVRMFTSNFRESFKLSIIRRIIKFIDNNLEYNPKSYIARNFFESSGIFKSSIDKYSGEDYIYGKLGKTQIDFSEILAQHESRDSKGRKHTTTIFKGIFFIADFNKNFSGTTFILPDTVQSILGSLGQTLQSMNITRPGLVKLEDPEFEKLFVVYSADQIEARYILSPSLMQRIVEFKKKTDKKIYLSFTLSKLFVAIENSKNLFEPRIFSSVVDFEPVLEYFRDIIMITGIVEDLNLNTRIWTKQ